MRDDDYEFLSDLTEWFNKSYYGVRYGKFSFIFRSIS